MFLNRLGYMGGSAAVFHGMAAMGLLSSNAANATTFREQWDQQTRQKGKKPKIAVLGAGIAGLTAAYELRRAGHNCFVMDARPYAGGRNRSIRSGDQVIETDSVQTCQFDVGQEMYFNAGPGRIPNVHHGILHYCHELGVRMEVLINDNRAALFHSTSRFGGVPQTGRAVQTSLRGNICELLAKAISRQALDDCISPGDQGAVLAMLRSFGALDSNNQFTGSTRGGIEEGTRGYLPGETLPPLDFEEIMGSDFWWYKARFFEGLDQATTMLQPVGGMDKIPSAFARKLRGRLRLNQQITAIRRTSKGVRIEFLKNGEPHAVNADYAIVTLPASVLKNIPNDFSPPVQSAISGVSYSTATKIAFQSQRFWETQHHIYGGISWTNQPILQMWYPSGGIGDRDGVLVGSYIWDGPNSVSFANLSPTERIEFAVSQGQEIHPEYRDFMTRGISKAWAKVPYNLGGWSTSAPPGELQVPDGPFIFGGEHTTYLGGWQEGAVISAHEALLHLQGLMA